MTRGQPPDWLASFQARFSSVLRAPLDPSTGTLRDRRESFSAAACADVASGELGSARAQLAVYNRQYWFRLLDVLQRELPLTERLLGSWRFNGHALRYLEQRAPHARDLGRVADGFAAFLELDASDPSVPERALVQAARIDEAFRALLRAAEPTPFSPTAQALGELDGVRLVRSAAVCFIEEDWPLLELRKAAHDGERALPLPPALGRTRHWALCGMPEGYRAVPLEPLHARLLALLTEHTVGQALAIIEHESGGAAELAAWVERWLAESIRLNFWTGARR